MKNLLHKLAEFPKSYIQLRGHYEKGTPKPSFEEYKRDLISYSKSKTPKKIMQSGLVGATMGALIGAIPVPTKMGLGIGAAAGGILGAGSTAYHRMKTMADPNVIERTTRLMWLRDNRELSEMYKK